MKHKPTLWFAGLITIVLAIMVYIGYWVVKTDPFFHYHKPITEEYYYSLDNERSQNNGIVRHFDFQGMITGTSMTQKFKTSEAKSLWGIDFVKVPFAGATFKEINDNIAVALKYNQDLKIVIRCLDTNMIAEDDDLMRIDLGTYPSYLYDDNIMNDVEYVFNRDIVFSRVYPMIKNSREPYFRGGITSFDKYSNSVRDTYGKGKLLPNGFTPKEPGTPIHLSAEKEEMIRKNIQQNVTLLADQYPDVIFYYFFPPYSILRWNTLLELGTFYEQIECERVAIEEILAHRNIRLFSFNNMTEITTDLNNYSDPAHYGEWINSLILWHIHEGNGLLTPENYEKYLEDETDFYLSFDYSTMNDQEDNSDDFEPVIRIAEEAYGKTGKELSLDSPEIQLSHATIVENQYEGKTGLLCQGCLQCSSTESTNYIRETDFVGLKITVDDIGPVNFIVFYGKKVADPGMPTVLFFDESGCVVERYTENYRNIDSEWHLYYINVADLQGKVTIVFNGGYIDRSGARAQYEFSKIMLY